MGNIMGPVFDLFLATAASTTLQGALNSLRQVIAVALIPTMLFELKISTVRICVLLYMIRKLLYYDKTIIIWQIRLKQFNNYQSRDSIPSEETYQDNLIIGSVILCWTEKERLNKCLYYFGNRLTECCTSLNDSNRLL